MLLKWFILHNASQCHFGGQKRKKYNVINKVFISQKKNGYRVVIYEMHFCLCLGNKIFSWNGGKGEKEIFTEFSRS